MKNSQKGSAVVVLLAAVVILLAVIAYKQFEKPTSEEQIQISDISSNTIQEKKPATPEVNNNPTPLSENDILTASYTISAKFGNVKSPARKINFPKTTPNTSRLTNPLWIDKDGNVLSVSTPGTEAFWIYKYEFTNTNQTEAKVYIGGNYGASGTDDRTFTVSKVNGLVITKENI